MDYDVIVIGCGLTGSIIARELAEKNKKILILERREHIGGNLFDYKNTDGILVQKYGPHIFHTNNKDIYEYVQKFTDWQEYRLNCGVFMNGKYTPSPFNFKTIDDFYSSENAKEIKLAIKANYPTQEYANVLELLNHTNPVIKKYAEFLFTSDYSPYTAKQWGIKPEEIDPSVLRRVPVRFNYEEGYFNDQYQIMPKTSYTTFFENVLNHCNITVRLKEDALKKIVLDENTKKIYYDNKQFTGIVVYTGAIDELFALKYGKLPYRSLFFEWKSENIKSFQDAPVVAYPQEKDFTRITEYTKLPVQDVGEKTVYAIEYPIMYNFGDNNEPYYPVPTNASLEMYERYKSEASSFPKLFMCGRLAEYKYYNMDQALERALMLSNEILSGE